MVSELPEKFIGVMGHKKAEGNQRKSPTGRKKTFLPWPSKGARDKLINLLQSHKHTPKKKKKKNKKKKKKAIICTQSL